MRDVGDTLVQSLNRFRSQPQSMALLQHLKDLGLNMNYLKDTSLLQESIFNGNCLCHRNIRIDDA